MEETALMNTDLSGLTLISKAKSTGYLQDVILGPSVIRSSIRYRRGIVILRNVSVLPISMNSNTS